MDHDFQDLGSALSKLNGSNKQFHVSIRMMRIQRLAQPVPGEVNAVFGKACQSWGAQKSKHDLDAWSMIPCDTMVATYIPWDVLGMATSCNDHLVWTGAYHR